MKYYKIRNRIKELSTEQKIAKPQRKTIHFKGNRTIEPIKASYIVSNNKYELMHLYMAYNVLKGKVIIYPTKKHYSKSYIDSLVKKYFEEKVA